MTVSLLLAKSANHTIVKRGDKLYVRRRFRLDHPDEPLHAIADTKLFIKAAIAKWGMYRVLDQKNKWGPEIDDKTLPEMEPEQLSDGEVVFRVKGE